MTEATLKAAVARECKDLMPGGMWHSGSDRGYPDVSFAWWRSISLWEFKYWNNKPFGSPMLQEIKCQQLSKQAICYYVIFKELVNYGRTTYIVDPANISQWKDGDNHVDAVDYRNGFDYRFVARFIKDRHVEAHR